MNRMGYQTEMDEWTNGMIRFARDGGMKDRCRMKEG